MAGITFRGLQELLREEFATQESFDKFMKVAGTDANFKGSTSNPATADPDLHNILAVRLMSILRHGAPMIPTPMWHYFALL